MSDAPTLATAAAPSATAAPAPSAAPAQPAATAPAQRVTPNTPEWAALSAEQRHEQLRGPPNPRAQGHSPARDTYEAAAARRDGTAAARQQQDPPSTEGSPASAEKFKIGKFEVSEGEIAGMLDRQAAEDLKRATLPATAAEYRPVLPEGVALPGGQTYTFDPTNPSLAAAQNWAHSKGLSQSEFSEVLAIYASHEAQQATMLAEVARAEIAKAGVNAPQRVDAISQWVRSEVGDADAKPILATIVTDAHLRFYEKLQHKITSQGSASFSQSHRAAPDTDGIPGFANMSFEQRRLAQDQRAARRR
jgi:hypothetical protein